MTRDIARIPVVFCSTHFNEIEVGSGDIAFSYEFSTPTLRCSVCLLCQIECRCFLLKSLSAEERLLQSDGARFRWLNESEVRMYSTVATAMSNRTIAVVVASTALFRRTNFCKR